MRYQWVNTSWGLTYNELKQSLLKTSYDEKKGSGFLLDEAYREGKLSGRYIQKETNTIEVTSPLGKTETYQQTVYQTYQFKIDMSQAYSLLLINPPRSSLPLTTALAKLTTHRLSIKTAEIDLVKWLDCTSPYFKRVILKKLDITQLQLNKDIVGTLTLRGSGDLLSELKRLPNSQSAKITKAEFSFQTEYGLGTATITHRGIAKMHTTLTDQHLLPVLIKTINDPDLTPR